MSIRYRGGSGASRGCALRSLLDVLYDAFICHAYEDKNDLVRDLAEGLREQHVEVWYDDFSLSIGSSLRRSIDRGLSQSRFGIVVLSPHFFEKDWSQWELDGLVARQNSSETDVLLPVWHHVDRAQVVAFSPPLADKIAAQTAGGVDDVVRQLIAVIKPQGSTLVVARQTLLDWGAEPPVISDDWWLDAAGAAESNPLEGGFQESMGWGRWGFPLPPRATDAEGRGSRLAWAAMQMMWQADANSRPITQVTHPDELHAFIEAHPGLLETCQDEPRFALAYAPQLTIRGFGGPMEEQIEEMYRRSVARHAQELEERDESAAGAAIGRDTPGCDEDFILRDPDFGHYDPSSVACGFVQGHGVMNGPEVLYYCHADYLAWLLSDASGWVPAAVRTMLLRGMGEWCVWPWFRQDRAVAAFGYEPQAFTGTFSDFLHHSASAQPGGDALLDLQHRLAFSALLLSLPEEGEELAARLVEGQTIERGRTALDMRGRRHRESASDDDPGAS